MKPAQHEDSGLRPRGRLEVWVCLGDGLEGEVRESRTVLALHFPITETNRCTTPPPLRNMEMKSLSLSLSTLFPFAFFL